MPFLATGIALGVGAIAQTAGSAISASAQRDIAKAQLDAQKAQRAEALKAAEPTSTELLAKNMQLKIASKNLARMEKLIASVDPAVREAGAQALKLLKGEQARTLDPAMRQRAAQREQLVGMLRSRLGAGAETSTPGIEALRKFDMDTSSLTAQLQEQTLNNLFNIANSQGASYEKAGATTQAVLSTENSLANRKIAAINANSLTEYAGAPFVGAALQGHTLNQLGHDLSKNAGTIGKAFDTGPSFAGSANLPMDGRYNNNFEMNLNELGQANIAMQNINSANPTLGPNIDYVNDPNARFK